MAFDLAGSVAVITGAGSGIGRASAAAFASRGARVLVTDLDLDRAEEAASAIGELAVPARCDVTQDDDLSATLALALDRFGGVDLLMNNVGVLAVGDLDEIPLGAWDRIIDINLMGIVRSIRVFLPHLVAQGSGYIVNTASTAGLFPYGYDRLPYTATKHAVVGLSESLAVYLRPRGIRVSCFCPAGVLTNIVEQMTFYGERRAPIGPNFGIVDAATAGETVARGVESGRFLIVTSDAVLDDLRQRGNDIEAYLDRIIEEYT